jgi:aspartate racemase
LELICFLEKKDQKEFYRTARSGVHPAFPHGNERLGSHFMKKSIGILGGMGPLATADLFRKIVLFTDAACDNDHIRVYIDDNPSIPDRTAAILSGEADPLPAMTDSLRKLEACGADCVIMPCNTAHYFLPRLQALTGLPFLSMLEAAAKACRIQFPGKTAAILATRGTLAAELYQTALTAENVPFLVPSASEQDALMEVIYDGVKAGAAPKDYRAAMEGVLAALTARGADYFILGCTELPLAFQSLALDAAAVDPTVELAKAAIRFCGYAVKAD